MSWPRPPTDAPLPIPVGLDLRDHRAARVLVIRLERVGDVLLTTPTLRALRARFPHARLELLTRPGPAALLAGNPHLDGIIPFTTRWDALRAARTFDTIVDLQRSTETSALVAASGATVRLGRSTGRWHDRALTHAVPAQRSYSAHLQASILRVLGVARVGLDLDLVVPAAARSRVDPTAGTRVAIAPGASSVTRAWPEPRWLELAKALRDAGLEPIVAWGPPEEAIARALHRRAGAALMPKTDLVGLAAWIGTCRLLIGACSAPRHLAVACKVPTITVHGASSIGGWTRPTPWHRGVTTEVPCRPCNRASCDVGVACLTGTPVSAVMSLVPSLLALGPEPPLEVPILAEPDLDHPGGSATRKTATSSSDLRGSTGTVAWSAGNPTGTST